MTRMPTGAAADAELRDAVAAAPLDRDVVRASGPDAASYLQGQLSQDVEALAVGDARWSFVLQPTGKVDAWVRVTRLADDAFLLDVDGGHGDALVARLLRFRLRTAVDVEVVPGWSAVAVRGPGSDHLDRRPPPGGVVVPCGWPGVAGFDVLGPAVGPPPGVAVVEPAALERLRIRAGVPRLGAELVESTIPAEVGARVVEASVSFTKGCYTGQELVARVDARGGNVPRHVRVVAVDGAVPPPGAELEVEGRAAGALTSVAAEDGGAICLASVARSVEPPAEGAVVVDGTAHRARIEALPSG
jgi:folate-binding protein YgfZ